VILHKTVEENLVLVPHGSEESVLEDDGGLLLKLVVSTSDPRKRSVEDVRKEDGVEIR
jgi:hypothetical protein